MFIEVELILLDVSRLIWKWEFFRLELLIAFEFILIAFKCLNSDVESRNYLINTKILSRL